jgi:ATP adenylyltransferase
MSHQDIISKVSTCFDKALDSKDVLFFPSTITKHVDLGVEVRQLIPIVYALTIGDSEQFELRLCPALQRKPQQLPTPGAGIAEPPAADAGLTVEGDTGKKQDPFMPPYSPNLQVGDLQDADGQEYAVLVSRPSESLTVDVIEYAAASSTNIQLFPNTSS